MDSIRVFCDSIKAVVSYSLEVPASIKECQTNWLDVAIVAIICFSVIAVVAICVFGYKCIKKQEIDARIQSEKDKLDREKMESENKRNMELKERKLNLLKEFCYDEIKAADGEKDKKLKAYNSEEVNKYIDELNS